MDFQKKKTRSSKRDGEDNSNSLRKRIRNIERTLQRKSDHLPRNVRLEMERELAAHQERVRDHKLKKKRAKMISKYHQVRFFERQKASRLVKRLRQQLDKASDPDDAARLKEELHIAEVDFDYAMYFPLMERYVSIYAPGSTSQQSQRDDPEHGDMEDSDARRREAGAQTNLERHDVQEGSGATQSGSQSIAAAALHVPRPPLWATVEEVRKLGPVALDRLRNRAPEAVLHSRASDPLQKDSRDTGVKLQQAAHSLRERGNPRLPAEKKVRANGGRANRQNRDDNRRHEPVNEGQEGDSDGSSFFEEL